MTGKAPGSVRVKLLPPAQRRLPAVKLAGMRRAGAALVVKSVDAELREIVGIASTPEIDRIGDQVVAEGAQFRLPLPLIASARARSPGWHRRRRRGDEGWDRHHRAPG